MVATATEFYCEATHITGDPVVLDPFFTMLGLHERIYSSLCWDSMEESIESIIVHAKMLRENST